MREGPFSYTVVRLVVVRCYNLQFVHTKILTCSQICARVESPGTFVKMHKRDDYSSLFSFYKVNIRTTNAIAIIHIPTILATQNQIRGLLLSSILCLSGGMATKPSPKKAMAQIIKPIIPTPVPSATKCNPSNHIFCPLHCSQEEDSLLW